MIRLRRMRRLAAVGLAIGCACGSGDEPPVAPSPAAPPPQAAAPGNAAPRIRAVRFEPDPPLPGQRVTAWVRSSDPDDDELRLAYRWTLDGRRAGVGASINVPEGTKRAQIEVSVVAHDGHQQSAPATARAEVGNRPPRILDVVLGPASGVQANDEISVSPRAEDPDGDPLEFRYAWRVSGREVSEAGRTLGSSHFRRGDVVEVQVRAFDGEDVSEAFAAPAIEILNSPPVIRSAPGALDGTGAFHYTPRVIDPDGDRRLRFTLLQGPQGMSIDWLSGRLSWVPTEQQAGRHRVEFEVDDQAGGVGTQGFVLEVGFADEESQPAPAAPAP